MTPPATRLRRACPRGNPLSQPPFPPPPATPGGGAQPPAAPTQIAFPGQVRLAPQPQFAPTPQQAQSLQQGPAAVGFPNYRSPAPSPKNLTSLIVGTIVVLLTIAFAVLGFLLVSGRGAGSPEGAAQGYFASAVDGDAGRNLDLTCASAAANTTEERLQQELDSGEFAVTAFDVGDATATSSPDGREAYRVPVTATLADGSRSRFDVTVVDESGWRVCGLTQVG
jgi:hypothetical protein